MAVHTHYLPLGWSTVHSRSSSEFSSTERVRPQMVLSQGWPHSLLFPTSSILSCSPCQIFVILYSSTLIEYRPGETNYFPLTQEFPAFYETLWLIIFSERGCRCSLCWVRSIQPIYSHPMLFSRLHLAFKAVPYIQAYTPKPRIHFSSLQRVPYGQTISSVIELP